MSECTVRLNAQFFDLDPMNVVWHGNYLKYFEIARDALFDSVGVDFQAYFMETGYLFPIIKSSVKHLSPIRYKDEFDCTATLVEARRKIVIDFIARRASDGQVCAKGRTEQVAVKFDNPEDAFTSRGEFRLELKIPERIATALD